jgi:hypothetical protein
VQWLVSMEDHADADWRTLADLSVLILVNEAVPHSACNVGRRPGRWKHGVGGRKHGVGGQLYNPDLSAGSAYPT